MGNENITVQLIYAQPAAVWTQTVSLAPGASAITAIQASQFAKEFPNYPYDTMVIGIYGQVCTQDRVLADADRVEIYRPLSFDAMESRRRRAVHRKAFMTKPKNRPKRRKAKLAAAQALEAQDKV